MAGRLDFRGFDLEALSALGEASYEGQVHGGAVVSRPENLAGLGQVVEVAQLEGVTFAAKCVVYCGEGLGGRLVIFA